MRMKRLVAGGIGGAVVAVAIGYMIGRARAAGIPAAAAMTYYGTLTDTAGAPITGSKNVQIRGPGQLPMANHETSTDQILVFNQVAASRMKPLLVISTARTRTRTLSSLLTSMPTMPV